MHCINYVLKKVNAKFNFVIEYKVKYRGKNSSWEFVLLVKARESSHHLVGKGKTVEELTGIEEQDMGKGCMLACEIAGPTPGEIYQVNLITYLTEEDHTEFADICHSIKL